MQNKVQPWRVSLPHSAALVGVFISLVVAPQVLASPAPVPIPIVRDAASARVMIERAPADDRVYFADLTRGKGDILVNGVTAKTLAPGVYRLHGELALSPVGDPRVAAKTIVIIAGEAARRDLNSLFFPVAGVFVAFALDMEVTTAQVVPVTIRWHDEGGAVGRDVEAAEMQRTPPVPMAPEGDSHATPDADSLLGSWGGADGMVAAGDVAKSPCRLLARRIFIESLGPVAVSDLTTDKICYRPGESMRIDGAVVNRQPTQCAIRITMTVAGDLNQQRVVRDETVAIPGSARYSWSDTFDTRDARWGHEAVVRVQATGLNPIERRAVFGVTTNIWEMALIAGQGPDHGRRWKDPSFAAQVVEKWRRDGYTGAELFFWAPCDFGDFTPESEDFVSGQMQYNHSCSGTSNLIAAAHCAGMSVSLYANLWCVAGRSGYELMRQHPTWVTNAWFDPASIELWPLMERGVLPPLRSWYRAEISSDPAATRDAIRHHAAEIVASHRRFGWDAIRYDTYLTSAWTKDATRLTREIVGRDLPGFQFGYNTFPLSDGALGALDIMLGGGGMAMVEYIRMEQYSLLKEYAGELLKVRDAVWAHGGHIGPLYRPPAPKDLPAGSATAADAVYVSSVQLAAGGHPYYAPLENDIGRHSLFALRYAGYLWDNRMQPIADPDRVISFPTGAEPFLWRQFCRRLQRGPGAWRIVVHLLNIDPEYRLFTNAARRVPLPWTAFPVRIRLPASAKIAGAWSLGAVPEPRHVSLSATPEAGAFVVTVPEVRFWNVLVVDYTE